MTAGRTRRSDVIAARLPDAPTPVSPWTADATVLAEAAHYGRYGDPVWRFGKQAPNHNARQCNVSWAVGPDAPWPTRRWAGIGRDFGMALLGRRPRRDAPARDGRKPSTVYARVRDLAGIARRAHASRRGVPHEWDETIGAVLVADFRTGHAPWRDRPPGPVSDRVLRRYLETLALLWLHRARIAGGPAAPPWPNFAAVSAAELVAGGPIRATLTPAVDTDVVDPAVWWALIRFAMRFVFVYGPDLLTAWTVHQNQGRDPRGRRRNRASRPSPLGLLETFTAGPDNRVPVRADGRPDRPQLYVAAGITRSAFDERTIDAPRCRRIVEEMVAAGRTTRYWFGPARDVPYPDGYRRPWVDHLDTTNLGPLVARLRDACYILICAFGALRDSETQGLRRGCVVIADGGYALSGEITKGKDTPARALWWIDPLVARAVTILEGLSDAVPVTDVVGGHLVPSDRLLWTTQAARFGGAGVGQGAELLRRCIAWINENAALFDLPRADDAPGQPAIPLVVTPRQLRVTFAAVAAMTPDGPLGVTAQLHDTFRLACAYMANRDSKWFDVHRAHSDRVTVSRLRGYLTGGSDILCGPGAAGLGADLHVAETDSATLAGPDPGDYRLLVDELLLAAGRTFGTSTLSHCRGRAGDARCATVFTAVDPDRSFTPNFDADVCFGPTVSDDCRNVVYDPPDHLPVWDLALAAYRAELDELPAGRDAARVELARLIGAASHRIAAMEQACRARPRPVLTRLLRELERYLDYVRFDTDIPGSAAQYRPLYLATRDRVRWVRDLLPTQDRPDWSLPATSELLLADRA